AEPDRGVPEVGRRILSGDTAREERDDAPRPRVAKRRPPDPHRCGNRKWQPWREYREPPLFVRDELGGHRTPRQPDGQLATEPAHEVVPPVCHHLDAQVGKVGLLAASTRRTRSGETLTSSAGMRCGPTFHPNEAGGRRRRDGLDPWVTVAARRRSRTAARPRRS